ncbi:hypothetical protein V2I75_02745 [Pseudomonas viridiflava]|uniref:hypothetical protein n=1 Tax=Pseudomonas viridiflava TaxID=33069 RepID=UPI002E9C3E93|nr:hypothetical protein [Pseudomonas viridiflava]WKW32852.1 hypothetical protein KIH13_02525 [Pseudomonas viridiflava]
MSQRIKRIQPRDNLCTTNDGEAIEHVHGTVVVWWQERISANPDVATIPMVDVVFRFLDKNDQVSGVTVVPIGVSRLGSFRMGTIWHGGKCIAEVDFGKVEEFTVDFTDGAWSYLSITGKHDIPYFKKDYELRRISTDEVVSDLLNFRLPDGKRNLLIPCIDFLYRCYGATSDVARILMTYEWSDVLTKLYATFEHDDPETWAVSPQRDIDDSDALLLATMRYNRKSELAAKGLYAQLDHARSEKRYKSSLKVPPWFEGPARLKARGRWINNGMTFLCLEITGLSQPQHHAYEIRREEWSGDDPEQAGPSLPWVKTIIDVPKDQDPYPVTDKMAPGGNAGSWGKPDPDFEIIGPACPVSRKPIERRYMKTEPMTVEVHPPSRFSTGDPAGAPNGTSHIYHHAKRVMGNGGVLGALWAELQYLKEIYPGFTSLAWYSEAQGFVDSPDFRLYALKPFDDDDRVVDGARAWLRYTDNATLRRGLLIIQAVINGQTLYLFELQRKKKREGEAFRDEQISGMSMNINDPQQARRVISTVCDKIRNAMGKFAQLEGLDVAPNIFRHYSRHGVFAADITLRKALEPFGVYLPLRKKSKPPQ